MINEGIDQSKHTATKKHTRRKIGLAAHNSTESSPLCFFAANVLSERPTAPRRAIPHHLRTPLGQSDNAWRERETPVSQLHRAHVAQTNPRRLTPRRQ